VFVFFKFERLVSLWVNRNSDKPGSYVFSFHLINPLFY
jgi:hypothetical protein